MIAEQSFNVDALHSGYLMKRNPTGSWQKRFCVVTPVKFIYYKHRSRVEKGTPQGTSSLVRSSCILPEAGDIHCLKKENCFILKSNNKEYYLCAETRKEFEEWIKCLCDIIITALLRYASVSPHSFKKLHFSKATPCIYCNTPIHGLGKQGYMCQACLTCVHKKCAFKLKDDCTTTTTITSTNSSLSSSTIVAPPSPKHQEKTLKNTEKPSKKGIMDRLRNSFSTTATQYGALDTPQLQLALIQTEEAEQKELDVINTQHNSQMKEIMDELKYRYYTELSLLDREYKKKREEIMTEIQLRLKKQQKQR